MTNPLHSAATGTEIHDFVQYVQTSDPGSVGAGKNWLDTTTATSPILKRRNGANNAWVVVATPSVLTTKGDILVFDGSNYVRLAIGADGTVLSADSGQANGVRWLAVGGGGLSDPTTTKGDLLARSSGAVTRLAVGSDGQVLQADSAQTTGVKWANPAGGYSDPLTTKGDIVGRTSGATVRKAIGTNGAVLSADSTQTDGLSWLQYADFGPPPPLTGRYVDARRVLGSQLGLGTSGVMVVDTLYGTPIWLRKGESYQAVSCEVTIAGAAGKLIRLGLYAYDATTGMAGALLWDAGTVAADGAAGVRDATASAPYVVPATGWYTTAVVGNGTPTMRMWTNVAGSMPWFAQGQTAMSTTSPGLTSQNFSRAFTFAALPDPFGGSPTFSTGSPGTVAVSMKVS